MPFTINQIKKLRKNITPPKWIASGSGDGKSTSIMGPGYPKSEICEPVFVIEHDDVTSKGAKEARANLRFLIAAPAIIDQLIERVEALERDI